jgi:hypothetical protein
MKVHVARDGEVIGEWTQTQLYKLLRICEVFPSDYYWHEGMATWERLAQLPCGKSVLATPAQRRMLTDCGLQWDEFTTKYDVSRLMDSRPCTQKQRSFMDDLGISYREPLTTKDASDLIDLELSGEVVDGPPTAKQLAILRRLAVERQLQSLTPISPSRREAAFEIKCLRAFGFPE